MTPSCFRLILKVFATEVFRLKNCCFGEDVGEHLRCCLFHISAAAPNAFPCRSEANGDTAGPGPGLLSSDNSCLKGDPGYGSLGRSPPLGSWELRRRVRHLWHCRTLASVNHSALENCGPLPLWIRTCRYFSLPGNSMRNIKPSFLRLVQVIFLEEGKKYYVSQGNL